MNEIKESIKAFISKNSFSEVSRIQDNSLIFREGLFDSMGLITLITFLEETYNVQILDSDLIEENFESVNAISAFLESKKIQA